MIFELYRSINYFSTIINNISHTQSMEIHKVASFRVLPWPSSLSLALR